MRATLVALLLVLVGIAPAWAQSDLEADADETQAFEAVRDEKWVRARELATQILRRKPSSFVAHHVLALAQHEGEANFPVALREERLALDSFATIYGDPPRPGAPWRWHAMMLIELAQIQGDLEQHVDRLATLERYNALYQPRLVAEQAWSLMKLRRFNEARLVAREGLASGDPRQVEIALNALCAVEFEAGEYGRSYQACKAALDNGRQSYGGPAVVDLTNFAEAARTELQLAESERALLEATGIDDGGYGNPHLELGELLLREGRLPQALDHLREVTSVRMRRVPSMRDSDRNESMRALAELYLVAGRYEDAVRITSRAVVMPDRRGHNSRDPALDRAMVALLDRAARLALAGRIVESTAGGPWLARITGFVQATKLRFEAWQSGRKVVEWLDDESRLVGCLQIGLASGGITPPWLVSDLSEILGPAVFRSAVQKARRSDHRPLARAYYDAMEAEAWLRSGSEDRAGRLAAQALSGLQPEEGLLAARTEAIYAQASIEAGRSANAARSFEHALRVDPSVLRRLGIALPARVRSSGGELARAVRDRLEAGGRFDDDHASFTVEVRAERARITVCLRGPSRSLGCETTTRSGRQDDDAFAARAVTAFYDSVLAPDLGIDARMISALEGPQRTERRPLDAVFQRRTIDVPALP